LTGTHTLLDIKINIIGQLVMKNPFKSSGETLKTGEGVERGQGICENLINEGSVLVSSK